MADEKRKAVGLDLSDNAWRVLRRRYLLKDAAGRIVETPSELFKRVAVSVAAADAEYGLDAEATAASYYCELAGLKFLPNSPTLMNAGTEIGQLSACFVLPLEDSIVDIFRALGHMALIHKSGGGTGFSFSRLRPAGDIVKTTAGAASGPVSFMRIFDTATEVIKQGGRRRGANMGILRVDHPDIINFIRCKQVEGEFSNFNISVAVTDDFMERAAAGRDYELVNPRTGKAVKELSAAAVLAEIVKSAWQSGDPGLVFIDRVNEANPTPELGPIEATNPCGEQPLLPYEACNLGSLNLTKFIVDGRVNWDDLAASVRLAVRFLDNVIDVNHYPLPEIAALSRANRKIGLGVMGLAEALILMGIPYDSREATAAGARFMAFIAERARAESRALAAARGPFPNFGTAKHRSKGEKPRRNATLTTIAPTGTISIIAGTSSGIEPLFALTFLRRVMEGTSLLEVNPIFKRRAKAGGYYSESLMRRVAAAGSIKDITEIPADVRRLMVTAFDIAPEWHVRMQAAFQKYVDNAVSKTVNLPADADEKQVRDIFWLAFKLKCKGITIYRYGSRSQQVLRFGDGKAGNKALVAEAEYGGGCLSGECSF